MSQVMHALRFVVGMSLLAGGAVLAQPFATAVLAARQPAGSAAAGRQAGVPPMMIGAGGHAIPDPRQSAPSAGTGGAAPGVDEFAPRLQGRADRQGQFLPATPPPPPTPLPASGLEWSPAVPPLAGTYRSTVDIPPPPLLDGHAPPPLAAGWSVHEVARPAVPGPAIQPPVAPAEYVVRDGDDLTGIALKVYGHAGATTAIWAANRDRLTDPQLLPIGLSLRLPPSWTLPAHASQGSAGGLAIEPGLAAAARSLGGSAVTGPPPAAPPARSVAESFWLEGAAVPSTSATPAAAAAAR